MIDDVNQRKICKMSACWDLEDKSMETTGRV